MRKSSSKSAPAGVIGKALQILELMDRNPGGLQLRDIAAMTATNKSTAHRFVSHLETENYLFRDDAGAYMLGAKLARLGAGASFQATLCRICRPTLESLRGETDESVNLAVLEGAEVVRDFMAPWQSPRSRRQGEGRHCQVRQRIGVAYCAIEGLTSNGRKHTQTESEDFCENHQAKVC